MTDLKGNHLFTIASYLTDSIHLVAIKLETPCGNET